MIVLLDPASNAGPCFFQALILRRPDFLLLQTTTVVRTSRVGRMVVHRA